MTETLAPQDDLVALRARVEHLTARLDRIETQSTAPKAMDDVTERLSKAWSALRGGAALPQDTSPAPSGGTEPRKPGLIWSILALCAGLLALILAIELADQVFDALADLWRWID